MKNGLSKKDSTLVYGIAILMMVYHHLFSAPLNTDGSGYFSILNTLLGDTTEQRLAWLCRLCVPFYAFISGYGVCTIISKKHYSTRRSFNSIIDNYLLALKQIFKLLKKYWLVFIIFIPMGVLFFNLHLNGPETFFLSLLGLRNDYNGVWWYIAQQMMMLSLFPIFDFVLCNILVFADTYIIKKFKYGKVLLLVLVAFCGIFFLLFRNAPMFSFFLSQLNNGKVVFTLVFFEGFLCAFFHLFEVGSDNPTFQKARPFLTIIILAACLGIRWLRAYDAVYCKYDTFITFPIIYSLVTLCNYNKSLTAFLQYFGKHSTYMWLTHTFFCLYYFHHWIWTLDVSILIFISTTILSLITSCILTLIENKFLNTCFKH